MMMYPMMRTFMVMAVVILVLCEAQVNFSPGWGTGKRSGIQEGACKGSGESLMYIYKLVQNEAQKLLECEKFSSN